MMTQVFSITPASRPTGLQSQNSHPGVRTKKQAVLDWVGVPQSPEKLSVWAVSTTTSPRWYRFISADPVTTKESALINPQGWNLYAYCLNSPIKNYDPDERDNYVFYDPRYFENQAKAEASQLSDKNSENTYAIPVKTESDFINTWNQMEKASGVYIGDLGKKNIGTLNLLVCHSGDLKKDGLAITFAKTQNVNKVVGYAHAVNFSKGAFLVRIDTSLFKLNIYKLK
jgi:hypothetical protein